MRVPKFGVVDDRAAVSMVLPVGSVIVRTVAVGAPVNVSVTSYLAMLPIRVSFAA
jgi:hypothetical protein